MHYLNVERYNSTTLYERYIEDGVEKTRFVNYEPSLFSHSNSQTPYKDIYGKQCVKRKFSSMWEADKWKRNMKESNIEVLGMDDYVLTYIGDTYKTDVEFDIKDIRIGVVDIEVTGETFPKPEEAIYAVDAITHYDSIHGKFFVFDLVSDGLNVWNKEKSILRNDTLIKIEYAAFDTEIELMQAYLNFFEENPAVIYSGWNSDGFDIPYLINRCKNIGLNPSKFSPVVKLSERIVNSVYGQQVVHTIHGVNTIDYLELYKKFGFTPLPAYSLDAAAKADGLAGKITYNGPINKLRLGNYIPSKIKSKESYDKYSDNLSLYALCKSILHEKLYAVSRTFEHDNTQVETLNITSKDALLKFCNEVEISENNLNKVIALYNNITNMHKQESHQRYIDYNIGDVEVIIDIEKNRQFFELVVSMAYHAKVPFDAVFSPLKTWDGIIYNSLKAKNEVIPTAKHNVKVPYPGAYVQEPDIGEPRKYVLSFDFTSLYPQIIRQLNISPEMMMGSFSAHTLQDYISKKAPRPSNEHSCSPNGVLYSKEKKGLIPTEIEKIFNQRKAKQKLMHTANRNIEIVNKLLQEL